MCRLLRAPTFVHLRVELRFEEICLWKQKGLLIRVGAEESAGGRLVTWLRSLAPTSAPRPRRTATDHISFSAQCRASLRPRMKFSRTGSSVV